MKRTLTVFVLSVCFAASMQAQRLDPTFNLRSYAAKVLPRCPAGTLTLEPAGPGPASFDAYVAKVSSSDKYCQTQKYLLHSKASQQVFVGMVIPLPADNRPANVRVAEHASKLMGFKLNAVISPFPLPDGVKSVNIVRETEHGSFTYPAFIDQSERFMIVGFRGSLKSDPARALRESLGAATAARRGSATAKVEILEISDFQCPTCAHAHEKIEPLIRKNLSRINYVRIDLPLFEHHEWAMPAAMGARAILKVAPAKYWDYVDYVFKNQELIGKRKNFDDVVREWSEDNDVDWNAVKRFYASPTERQALLDQVSRAFALGIASTPTFVINGQIMGFGPEGEFTMNAIRAAVGDIAPAPAAKKPAR